MWANPNVPVEIRDDKYYYDWMEDILEAFPNKGPPSSPTRLTSSLYIGSLSNAEDTNLLKRLGITHVLNIAGTRRFDLEKSPYAAEVGIKGYLMIPAEDVETYDMLRHFPKVFAFIDHCKQVGGKCLVHCNLGVNRSGAVCAGYLLHHEKKPLLQVIVILKKARQVILCNSGFRYQLITYARKRNLLDPVYQQNGYPLTIPPPTGHSKFSKNAVNRHQTKGSESPKVKSSKPRDGNRPSATSASSNYSTQNELHVNGTANFVPRPRIQPLHIDTMARSHEVHVNGTANFVPRPRIQPLDIGTMARSHEAPRKHRKAGWSDPEIDAILDPDMNDFYGLGDDVYDYDTASLPRSFSHSPYSSGTSTFSRTPSSVQRFETYRNANSYRNVGPLTLKPDQRSPAITIGGKSVMSRMSSDAAKTLVNDILKRSTYDDLCSPSGGMLTPNGFPSRPYNTITRGRDGGMSFNVPKPPFGTSRRRFAPASLY